jgi:phage portal protein BeeE
VGYSAKDLQLTEAREHAALEVARLLQLPAFAVDAKGGDSMTYANIVDRRKDLVESLRPWTTVLTQTMSMDVRLDGAPPRGLLLPRGVRAEFDAAEYLRDDANTRMGVWAQGLDKGILQLDDVIDQEPLARKASA